MGIDRRPATFFFWDFDTFSVSSICSVSSNLKPRVLLFVHSPLHPTVGGEVSK